MRFQVNLEMVLEVDEIDLKTAAVRSITESGGVQSGDGSEVPFGAEMGFVAEPEHAAITLLSHAMIPHVPLAMGNAELLRWSPRVTVID